MSEPPVEPNYKALAEAWQANGDLHPWTCNGGNPDYHTHHLEEVRLEPHEHGLRCPKCGRFQPYGEWEKQMLTIMNSMERIRHGG